MEKRLIMAIALSLLVMLVFQKINPRKEIQVERNNVFETQKAKTIGETKYQEPIESLTAKGKELLGEEELIEIRTERFNLFFSDLGGNLQKLSLNEYKENGEDQVLIDEEDPEEMMFFMTSDMIMGLNEGKFSQTKSNNTLTYTKTDKGLVEVSKTYSFGNIFDYIVLDVSVKNLTPNSINFEYTINGPADLKQTSQVAGRSFSEADIMQGNKVWKVKRVKNIQEKTGDIKWTALKNRYFTLILKPEDPAKTIEVKTDMENNLSIGMKSRKQRLAPGEKIEERYVLYAGPLDEKRIEKTGMEVKGIVDYGFFGGISRVLLLTLGFFHKIVKNWGIGIILLTIAINVVMFPLTYKSFSSMQQMKKVQPHMQKLREIHKDNPQKLNKEMMELYRKYNVNPLGGCLPMLLQMPIFISLYQGLIRSVSLKGASFLWIKDLSQPDGISLPISLPLIGNTLNILPLIMVGVMVLQQRISQKIAPASGTTEEQIKQQKMMMMMMPIFFGFLFYRMPSGLVLYWLTNTILMTAEQSLIAKRSKA